MILSKLILFFCFYLLLFLNNSLGQKLLVELDENKKLLKDALDFGATFGGLLGLLGSQWKQLLIQLVHAKRNVGLGKYQLARLNDSATTEEVGLAITDSYADKVAELVAIRTEDIGATPKYIDDLEILKNEIALTMIVEMEKIEAQFKEQNVRRKVKEAKENGLTDTDIKEILFAEFIESEGGLSLIDGRASIADRLLSSFLNGMKSILYKTYYKKLGITEYGNTVCGGITHPLAGSDSDSKKCVAPESSDGGSGGAPGDGGSGGAPGGGGSGDPPGGPPSGPPSSGYVPDKDKEDDKNETEKYVYVNGIRYTAKEAKNATQLVRSMLSGTKGRIRAIEYRISEVQSDVNEYEATFSLQLPQYREQNETERLDLYNRRYTALWTLLREVNDLIYYFDFIYPIYESFNTGVIQNYEYYSTIFFGGPRTREQMRNMPFPLDEFFLFDADGEDNVYRIRYYIARLRRIEMFNISIRYDNANRTLSRIRSKLSQDLKTEKGRIEYETKSFFDDD